MKIQASLISLLLFLVGVGMRFALLLVGGGAVLTVLYYLALVLGIAFLAYDSYRVKAYSNVFVFDNRFHLDIFAYGAGVGFFIDFVSSMLSIYHSIDDKSYHILTSFVPLCVSCAFALLSSFYYIVVGSSFGGSNYDFRKLRVFHIAPLFWAGAKLFGILDQAVGLLQDDIALLKYITLIFGVCLFFFLVNEVDNTDDANVHTVFLMRSFYYTGIMYFINQLMLLLSGSIYFTIEDGMLGVSVLLISGFMYFCEKNIIAHTSLEV